MKKALKAIRNWQWWRRNSRGVIAICLALVLVFAPVRASAGVADLISILNTIFSTLRGGIGGVLNQIQGIDTAMRDHRQQVVWPVMLVNQARSFVTQISAQYRNRMWQIHTLPANSATLATPTQFESLLRSRQANNLGQLQPAFQRLYQPVPPSTAAPAVDRNLVDMDDATSMAALKTTVISDQSGNQILSFADGLEQQAAQAAPGSAPLLTAQAQVANLESQAFLQRLFAAELRQEAARLAHENALRKRSAQTARGLRMQVDQALTRR